jgi:hypothetical protein
MNCLLVLSFRKIRIASVIMPNMLQIGRKDWEGLAGPCFKNS